jgi:hypothetical protein
MAWPRRTAVRVPVLGLALLLAACGSSSPTASPSTATPAGSPPPATPPASTSAPASGPAGTNGDILAPDMIGLVATDDLRVRSKAGTGGKVQKRLLDAGTLVYVIAGPVEANGYRWYHVQPFGPGERALGLPSGWVAAGDKDGTPWLQPATIPCPALPVDGPALEAIGAHAGLACFGSQELTFQGRLVVPEGMCGSDPALEREPAWLDPCSSGGMSLVAAQDPSEDVPGLEIAIDPSLTIPERLQAPTTSLASAPLVEVSGQYDHAAAKDCRSTDPKGVDASLAAEIVLGCRLRFVVPKAAALGG